MNKPRMPPFQDMHRLDEGSRIKAIGEAAQTKLVGVLLERNEPDKQARYVKRVTESFPTVRHVDTTDGPTSGTVLVRFGPKAVN